MPFLKSLEMSLSSSLWSVELMVFIKYASNTLCLQKFSRTILILFHVNLWFGFSFKLLAGSDLLFLSSCSFHRILPFQTVKLSLPLLKWSIMDRANLLKNPVPVYLLIILLIWMSKLETIFFALCNSPIIPFRLYITGIFDIECTGSIFISLCTWVVILLLLRIISLSRNQVGFNSKFSFIFWLYEFNAL